MGGFEPGTPRLLGESLTHYTTEAPVIRNVSFVFIQNRTDESIVCKKGLKIVTVI